MGLFKEINRFGDLFHSIRQHQQYFVIDLKMPLAWEVESLVTPYAGKVAYKVNNENKDYRLISFFSTHNETAINTMIDIIEEVIRVNKDTEEKRSLLIQKKVELENMFNNFSLNELKKISFNVETELELKELEKFEEKIDGNRTEGSSLAKEEYITGPEGTSQK